MERDREIPPLTWARGGADGFTPSFAQGVRGSGPFGPETSRRSGLLLSRWRLGLVGAGGGLPRWRVGLVDLLFGVA
ncbi:MAG: hypothetical protein DYG94_04595 [Leptolyngbya sp. PLA3]|nr:MAG: hypothetical protein EDM82_03745 [Cyanobacteria bacterium CYA]MCE7968010.1 hypothetical protein [Leptolyngbya sp. PL-A3]